MRDVVVKKTTPGYAANEPESFVLLFFWQELCNVR